MNRYRRPLILTSFTADHPPLWVRRWLATELVAELPGGRMRVTYYLVGVSAN